MVATVMLSLNIFHPGMLLKPSYGSDEHTEIGDNTVLKDRPY